MRLFLASVLPLALFALPADCRPILDPASLPELHRLLLAQTRMFHAFSAAPFGIGLTAEYRDADALAKIQAFLGQDASDDPKAVTGKHAFELMTAYEGPAGIGLRGGGSVPATAFRYKVLKQSGAPMAQVAAARRDVLRAIETLHVVHVITGVPGVMARGVQRLVPEDPSAPPIPASVPELIPLFDDQGNPLPPVKDNGTNRADASGGHLPPGTWIWQDSCSKDQLVGWVLATVTLYDAILDDPDISPGVVAQMREDARLTGAMLRGKHPFQAMDGLEYDYDLVIMDADGRPTLHHDLNPLSIDGTLYLPPDATTYNVFNLVMALGIVKGLWHVSGDPEAEAFLYDELLGRRGYLDALTASGDSVDYLYIGAKTNFSNVNMAAIALFLDLWTEKDPVVRARSGAFLEDRWWNPPGVAQAAARCKEPYFHAIHLASTDRGTDPAEAAEAAALLQAFPLAPYLNPERINCDAAELASGSCLAVDGKTTLTLQTETNRGGHPIANQALDPSIRPPSEFNARSDPFEVNGGGGNRVNPGGDLLAAYWILRATPERNPGESFRSHAARDHRPVWGVEYPSEPNPEPEPEPAADILEPQDSGQEVSLSSEASSSGKSGGCTAGNPVKKDWFSVLAGIMGGLAVFRCRAHL